MITVEGGVVVGRVVGTALRRLIASERESNGGGVGVLDVPFFHLLLSFPCSYCLQSYGSLPHPLFSLLNPPLLFARLTNYES